MAIPTEIFIGAYSAHFLPGWVIWEVWLRSDCVGYFMEDGSNFTELDTRLGGVEGDYVHLIRMRKMIQSIAEVKGVLIAEKN